MPGAVPGCENIGRMGLYRRIAAENSVIVAPVSQAFYQFQKEYPDISIIKADEIHPTQLGSFLAALLLYCSIFEDYPSSSSYTLPYVSEDTIKTIKAFASGILEKQ